MQEIEVKFLNINVADLVTKLESLGAQKVGDFNYRRQVMDFPGFTLDKKGAWLRIRDEGEKIIVAYKQRQGWEEAGVSGKDTGMKEIELEVNSFEQAINMFTELGMVNKHYVENKRNRYVLSGVEFDIDYWPMLEPYLEIEAKSKEEIDKAIELLGYNKDEAKVFSTAQIYELNGINQIEYEKMTFSECLKRI